MLSSYAVRSSPVPSKLNVFDAHYLVLPSVSAGMCVDISTTHHMWVRTRQPALCHAPLFKVSLWEVSYIQMRDLRPTRMPCPKGLPRRRRGKESACSCGRRRFDPWIGKISWSRRWPPAPVLLPEKNPWTEDPGGL